jgi:hypothetical protein
MSGTIPEFEGAAQPLSTLTFSLTGTSTLQSTYSDSGLTSANTNPVVADAYGYFGEIFLNLERYKVVWKNASGTTLKTFDPVDKEVAFTRGAGLPADPSPGQKHANTSDGHTYKYKLNSAAWLDLGLTDAVGNTASVTEVLTGTDATKFPTADSLAAIWQRGTNITPSAGTVSLPSTGGGIFSIAAGNFAAISTAQGGREIEFIFAGASTITHNGTSLILLTGADETTYAGVVKRFRNEAATDASGANWREVSRGAIATQAQMETGTEIGATVVAGRQHFHPGHPKWFGFVTVSAGTPTLQTSYNLTSITDTGTGILTATIANDHSSANYAPFCTVQWTATTPSDTQCFTTGIRSGTIAAGSVGFDCYDQAAGQAYADPASWSIFGLGDI